jgi:cytochrome oxidase Cu insertion factor (SCO1/SenC/PrrC family)
MNSKFALFFIFQEKVIGKTNTQQHRRKIWNFYGIFFEEQDAVLRP